MPRLKVLTLLSLATLWVPAFSQGINSAGPGTLNYIEGQASIDGRALSPKSVGTAALDQDETLATSSGKVELLLTPGMFLRLGENSTVKMVSPDLTRTEVELERGHAELEVDRIYKQNDLLIDMPVAQGGGDAQTHVLKNALYAFDAAAGNVRVFEGKAEVFPTATAEKGIGVKGGRELTFNAEPEKPRSSNKNQAEDDLYRWSSLRSQYLGEANARLASEYASSNGFNPGWNWDPGLYSYTWLPGDGLFMTPFGFGFYSPAYFYGGGLFYGGGDGLSPGFGYGGHGFRGGAGYVSSAHAIYSGAGFREGSVGGAVLRGGGGGFHGGGHR